ncbi:MAG TPA: alpha/beta hydrolase-fold protein [Micrococcaceae bacterium]
MDLPRSDLLHLSLVSGAVPELAWLLGVAGGVYLLARWGRRWLLTVLLAAVGAVALAALIHWLLIDVLSVFPEDLPAEVVFWWSVVLAGVGLAVACYLRFAAARPSGRRRRILAPLAALGVVLLASVQINLYFGLNPTLGDLLGTSVVGIPQLGAQYKRPAAPMAVLPLTSSPGPAAAAASSAAASSTTPPSTAQWQRPADLPANGVLRHAAISGTVSGFSSRNAYIYLPPAYLVRNRPQLPVLVLFSGQPGAPGDWLTGGQLAPTMDRYAAAHNGLAPVVVVVDPNGTQSANTLCMDSNIARADTYLSVDVPRWIVATLDVEASTQRWAAGGFSFGATCALELGARHPDIFPNVIAFSAEREPALAKDRSRTIQAAFGGDVAWFDSRTPLDILAREGFSHSSVYFSAGADDPDFVGDMAQLSTAARGAGFRVRTAAVPDVGHSWAVPVHTMGDALDFLGPQLGLVQ